MTRLVVLAWGNPSRGDDALGPEFLRHAAALPLAGELPALVTDFQLQPEHAIDLDGRDLALFVDASTSAHAPFTFAAVAPARDRSFTSHAMSPAAVLATYAEVFKHAPPPAFALGIRGDAFVLGAPVSAAAQGNLRHALAFYRQLLDTASVPAWEGAVRACAAGRAL